MALRNFKGLTARAVATQAKPGLYADGGGLYLQVAASGARSWIYRYQLRGRRRDMGLGSTSIYSLAEAREKARGARRLVADGIDPIDHRNRATAAVALAAAKTTTFRHVAAAYIASKRPGWKNAKHASQWEATLATYVFPVIGDLAVSEVDTGLLVHIIEPLWSTKPETASRVRGRIEAILSYAKVRGWRDGENPARWRGHLDQILPAPGAVANVKHHASLAYEQLPAFWMRLAGQEGLGARALEFAILTAARTSEVIGAEWDEFDFANKVWTVPPERMKAGVEHRVPLSPPAMTLLRLRAAEKNGSFVFPGNRPERPLSNMSMTMILRRMKVAVTTHGFRSTFRTWAAEQTSLPREVAEACLAHTIGSEVELAYLRTTFFDKRSKLMAAWGRFVMGGQPAQERQENERLNSTQASTEADAAHSRRRRKDRLAR